MSVKGIELDDANRMRLDETLSCALPLLAEGNHDEFPYWFGGTCFLVRRRGQLLVPTARHNLKTKTKTKDEVRVLRNVNSNTFVRLLQIFVDQTPDLDDWDYSDWAVFSTEEPEHDENDRVVPPLDLDAVRPVGMPSHGDDSCLVVRGYPTAHSSINYDDKRMKWQAVLATGSFVGPSPSNHCWVMRFDDLSRVDDIDGLSGAPVFLLGPTIAGRRTIEFAGMMIRGSKASGVGHFIRGDLMWLILDRVARDVLGEA